MPTEKFKNAQTGQGDNYHHLIALEYCIEADEGDIIYLEQRCDVATHDVSIEVKHHDGVHNISDRHIDFWKTLKNWVVNYNVIKDYRELILLTTSQITQKSRLTNWNVLKKEDKLTVLKNIVDEDTTETIKPFVDVIFNYENGHTQNILLSILKRFKIKDKQPQIKDRINEILKREFFKPFPTKSNKKQFMDVLIKYIVSQGRDNPEDWKIEASEFMHFIGMNSCNYTKKEMPMPDLFRDLTANVENFEHYKFIREIKKIGLENKISDATNDYFRTQKTVTYLFDNDPIVPKEMSYYQDGIILKDLENLKNECLNNIDNDSTEEKKLKESRSAYFRAMRMPLKLVKGYDPNQDFFQRGTIHTIVDSDNNDFEWSF